MSTNKTENYNLHAWVAGDDFLREEINENFALLDEEVEKCRVVMGSYMGTGLNLTQDIELGFRPRAVLVMPNMSNFGGERRGMLGLSIEGKENNRLMLTDTGFQVAISLNVIDSSSDGEFVRNPWRYLAWR